MIATILRIALAVLAGIVGISILIYNDYLLRSYIETSSRLQSSIYRLTYEQSELKSELLKNSTFLYASYDSIHRFLNDMEMLASNLENRLRTHRTEYPQTLQEVKTFHDKLQQYEDRIYRFLDLNARMKSSLIYIPTLQLRSFTVFDLRSPDDRDVLLLLARISSTVFLIRNAHDSDFLKEIKSYHKRLQGAIAIYKDRKRALLQTVDEHLQLFAKSYPEYLQMLHTLTHPTIEQAIVRITTSFQKESKQALHTVTGTTQILLVLYLIALIIVIILVIRTYRENRELHTYQKKLERTIRIDPLTGLENRLAFDERFRHIRSPLLILCNIDRFKHINEFYGSAIGDEVLRSFARYLQDLEGLGGEKQLFRMGGDEFAILIDRKLLSSSVRTEDLVISVYESLDSVTINVEDLLIDLSVTIGASTEKERLLETADIALKHAKTSKRKHFALYTPAIDNRNEIANNIHILKIVNRAITEGNLLPYFQPIYALHTASVEKFEALARIETPDGELFFPAQFIQIANEAKLSGAITLTILRRTLESAQKDRNQYNVNIYAEDLLNDEDFDHIVELLHRYRDVTSRITFELLETEEIRDYEAISDAIAILKSQFDCQIAIDDFGSGYSNFESLLRLDLDMIKVDGSLIQRIDRDPQAELLVRSILEYAKGENIRTVAEFVHSESVFEKVCQMGFDYAQGFYVAKPAPQLETVGFFGNDQAK
ncbi:EAL domain-containing protein [Nitratifractor sp.]